MTAEYLMTDAACLLPMLYWEFHILNATLEIFYCKRGSSVSFESIWDLWKKNFVTYIMILVKNGISLRYEVCMDVTEILLEESLYVFGILYVCVY